MGLTYILIYLICNLAQTYIVYYLYNIFLGERRTKKYVMLISYLAFYVINSSLYLLFKLPIVNISVCIVGFVLLTLNYKCSLLTRIIAPLLLYVSLVCAEVAVGALVRKGHLSITQSNNQSNIFIPVASTILMYAITLLLGKLKNIKNSVHIPALYWVILSLIPFCALYFLLLIMRVQALTMPQVGITSILILFFVFSTFYLYDAVVADLSDRMEKELLRQESKFYNYQLTQMQNSSNAMVKLRHDMKNHLISLQAYAENDKKAELLEYLEKLNSSMDPRQFKSAANTGNIVIDSIVNYKIQDADKKGVEFDTTFTIPDKLDIAPFDLVIILGNLLDNAIQATSKLVKDRKISLKVNYDKGRLILKITNPYNGEIKVNNNQILSLKNDSELHGFGLNNVRSAVKKYNGLMDIDYSGGIFAVTIMLYI